MMAIVKKTNTLVMPLMLLATISQAKAADELTQYLESNNSALTSVCSTSGYLPDSCPIGEALWGNQGAKLAQGESEFWIQCGVFSKSLGAKKVSRIQSKVDAPINMKEESKGKRCLIGPYNDFSVAKKQLKALQKDPLFRQSALREVTLSSLPKMALKAEKSELPKIAVEPTPDPVTIRKQVIINGEQFAVPFIQSDDYGFYMEDSQPWLRASSKGSQEICQRIDMNLVSKEQWQILIDSNIMKEDKWPILLPYWGADNLGLFKDGATRELKNASMLNVMCTKKAEDKVVGNPI